MTKEITTTGPAPEHENIEGVLSELLTIRSEMLASETAWRTGLDEVHPNFRDSARNLLHYLALRRRDLRPLQHKLAAMGLSSLGRAESHVLATIDAVLGVLHLLLRRAGRAPAPEAAVGFVRGQRLLADHTQELLGPAPAARAVRIMITMPSEAADHYLLVHDLLQQGMDCMRINCAHDDAAAWSRMIEHLRQAEHALGRSCRVVMDLAGPKLRTGPLEPGPAVVRIRPQRDVSGRVTAPARVWLTAEESPSPPPTPADASLPVPRDWLACLRHGEHLDFTDARGSRRTIKIIDVTGPSCWAESTKTAYVVPGTLLRREHGAGKSRGRDGRIGPLPPLENALVLRQGDLLVISRDLNPGRAATHDAAGQLLTPAMIGCTIPGVFDDVRAGEAIWFDDGKIGGVIEKVEDARVLVRITRQRLKPLKLRADKGINLPDSEPRRLAEGPSVPRPATRPRQEDEGAAQGHQGQELETGRDPSHLDQLPA